MRDMSLPANRSVLAVDDEPGVLAVLIRVLKEHDYQVAAASNAEAGLELAREQEFALVISDNIMPGMRGLEFLSIIMHLCPETRRILVTGYTDFGQAIDAFNHGIVNRYLQKPWVLGALAAAIEEEWKFYQHTKEEQHTLRLLDETLKRRTLLMADAMELVRRMGGELEQSDSIPALERKLAAILHGDVVGFSRLMGADHETTLHTLTLCRQLIADCLSQHHGRLVNTAGDSVLAEFPSAIDAVACAVKVQAEMNRRNQGIAADRRMVFRFGVNVGDVLVKGGDLFGEGVNVAARLQALAPPSGVFISETVHSHVKLRLPYQFQFQGEQRLKNISEPVGVYSVLIPEADGTGSLQ